VYATSFATKKRPPDPSQKIGFVELDEVFASLSVREVMPAKRLLVFVLTGGVVVGGGVVVVVVLVVVFFRSHLLSANTKLPNPKGGVRSANPTTSPLLKAKTFFSPSKEKITKKTNTKAIVEKSFSFTFIRGI
jgi:hypothetical protein